MQKNIKYPIDKLDFVLYNDTDIEQLFYIRKFATSF